MNAYHFRFNPFRLLVSLNNVLKHLEVTSKLFQTRDKIKSHHPYGPLVVSVMSGTSEDGALRGFKVISLSRVTL